MRWAKQLFSSYWLRSGVFKMMERVLLLAFAYVIFYFLVRFVSKEAYGSWTLYLTITTFVELLRMGFISKGLMRCIGQSTDSAEYAEVESAALLLNLALTVISSIALWFGAPYFSAWQSAPLLTDLIRIYSILNFTMVFFYHLDIMQQANMDFKASSLGQTTYKGVQFGLTLIYLFWAEQVNLMVLAWVQGAAIIAGTLTMYYYGKQYLSWRWRPKIGAINDMVHYGKWTFGTNASAILMKNIDSWMLGAFLGPAAVAVYGLAIRIANVLDTPVNTLSTIMFPKMVQRIQEEGMESARPLYEKSVAVIIAVILPIILLIIVFSDPIVTFMAEERYDDAAPVLQITVLFSLLMAFNKQVGTLLDATGEARTNFLFVLRNAVINVGLNYWLISNYGIIGAAIATLSTYTISMLLNQWYISRKYKINAFNYIWYIGSAYRKGVRKARKMLAARAA